MENKFICQRCSDFFNRSEMVFDTEYDCDLCKECYEPDKENK